MFKILFMNFINESSKNLVCLGQLSLMEILKNTDLDTEILDLVKLKEEIGVWDIIKKKEVDKVVQYVAEKEFDVLDIYTMADYYPQILYFTGEIKKRKPFIKIVLGGPQASVTARETLEKYTFIDAVGIGEGEGYIYDFLKGILEEDWRKLQDIKGICFRQDQKVIYNGQPDLLEVLDELPVISIPEHLKDKMDYVFLDMGRGCPFSCTFCSTCRFWKRRFRMKSPERIVDEIKYYIKETGLKIFAFTHDLFTLKKEVVFKVCEEIINQGLEIEWSCSSRADTIDEETLDILKKAGCTSIFLGIESASERIQKSIKKNLNMIKVREIINIIQIKGFALTVSFIHGFPNEEIDDLKLTMNLIRDCSLIGVENILLSKLVVFPGTEIHENNKDKLRLQEKVPSMIREYANEEIFFQEIKKHPDIFSYCYSVDNHLEDKTGGLGNFVMFILPYFYKYLSMTYRKLLEIYDNNLLEIFFSLKKYSDEEAWSGDTSCRLEAVKKMIEHEKSDRIKRIFQLETKKFEGGNYELFR